jgi:oxygen-independent coproporphyrinogen-3 oxidase
MRDSLYPRIFGLMDEHLIAKYDRRVARYTSYPTAPHFHAGVDADVYHGWLSDLPAETPLSLYMHIPFCGVLCWYCGCQTTVVNRYGPIAGYLENLRRELDLLLDVLGEGRPVSALHWGGGTPNMLNPDDIRGWAALLKSRFAFQDGYDFSIEIDPRLLTEGQVEAFAEAGVTRLSFGVQDFDAKVQKAINRLQPFEKTRQSIDWFRAAGVDKINFDLLYGLPFQTVETIERTVDQAMELWPDRLALFGYAHVPWMRKHQTLIDESALPGAGERLDMARAAVRRIESHGMVAIGLDHFARPDDSLTIAQREGRLRRNFQGYTDDPCDVLIGLGASSIGSLPQGYVQNRPDVRSWRAALEVGQLPVARGVALNADDRLRRDVIERLMCDLTVDLAAMCRRHGMSEDYLDACLPDLLGQMVDGLVVVEGRTVTVPEWQRQWIRIPASAFDAYFSDSPDQPQHARAV